MNISRRHLLILLPAAAVAWKFVEAGTPEASPNYQMSEHWWGMLINIPKCIGCGNCVRACQTENDVPDGNFRTWVERYHVTDTEMTNARSDFARRRQGRFSGSPGGRGQVLLRPQNVQPLRRLALHAGVPGGRDVHQPGRRGAGGSDLLPGLRVLRAGLSVWLPLPASHQARGRQMHAVLSPHHQGADHRMLRGLPHGSAAVGRFEESQTTPFTSS